MSLVGRVAYVTGGSSGIGEAIVDRLRTAGAEVASLDLQPPRNEQIPWEGCDVSDAAVLTDALDRLQARFGPADIAVHAAGVTAVNRIEHLTDDQWDVVLGTNLTGAFNLLRALLPDMVKQGWGRIVTVSSGAAVRVTAGRAAYASAKAGLHALTKVAALEGAPDGVTANVVAPGATDTPMTRAQYGSREELVRAVLDSPIGNPMGVVLAPGDIAAAVLFLCSDEAWPITGQVLHVSAGSVMP